MTSYGHRSPGADLKPGSPSRETAAQYSRLATQTLGALDLAELLVLVRRGDVLINLPADNADHISLTEHAALNVR